MDKGIEALIADMKSAAEKATPGEWYSDHIDTDGSYGNGDDCREGWRAAGVYSENGDLLLDSSNSDAATICEECDEDGFIAFDETGFKNAEFVVSCRPENVLKLIAALEQAQSERDKFNVAHKEWNDKTEWVQKESTSGRFGFQVLGMHRADVMTRYIAELESAPNGMMQPVKLPEAYAIRSGHPINENERSVMIPKDGGNWFSRLDIEHALRVAGVKFDGGE